MCNACWCALNSHLILQLTCQVWLHCLSQKTILNGLYWGFVLGCVCFASVICLNVEKALHLSGRCYITHKLPICNVYMKACFLDFKAMEQSISKMFCGNNNVFSIGLCIVWSCSLWIVVPLVTFAAGCVRHGLRMQQTWKCLLPGFATQKCYVQFAHAQKHLQYHCNVGVPFSLPPRARTTCKTFPLTVSLPRVHRRLK